MFNQILSNVRAKTPLVHSITNYVTANDCANIILAGGGSPIMADDIREVADITAICSSLVINMGTLGETILPTMIKAGRKANELGHPVVFDPVGAGASRLRKETAFTLLKEVRVSVIRGNSSEITFLATGEGSTQGVDASPADQVTPDNIDRVISLAKAFSEKTGSVIAITGATDIVANKDTAYVIKNGHPLMSRVTGTGCMLTALIGCYLGANPDQVLDATAAAVAGMGLCGELAYSRLCKMDGGTNMYRMLLIDFISKLNGEMVKGGAKVEVR